MKKYNELAPRPGTVFINTRSPDLPCIVQKIVVGRFEIVMSSFFGDSLEWGSIEDWHDALRRGIIRVVYSPKKTPQDSTKKSK